jgi:hypothetical protein
MPKKFTQPDLASDTEEVEVQTQASPETPTNMPKGDAGGLDAYDMADYISQTREGASTGARQKLEAGDFVDEELLSEAGYSDTGEFTTTETAEVIEEPATTEISEEWLEIFAWAGVELTDEAMPRLLQYLHAEDDYNRFKLVPTRRDKLKLAWIAFLRKVLPAMDDKQGLLAVIIMLYIENIVVGVWKVFGRVMSGTFTWPTFWPFTRFNKKKEKAPEPVYQEQPAPAPEFTADELALMDEEAAPAPIAAKEGPKAKPQVVRELPPAQMQVVKETAPEPKPEPVEKALVILAPVPSKMPGGTQIQDPIDDMPFEKENGMPKEDWEKTAHMQTTVYRCPKHTFRTQATFQKWLWANDFYKYRGQK